MGRTLIADDTVIGRIIFLLLDDNGNKLATVYATPYNASIIEKEVESPLHLTQEEKLYCELETLKTVPR